MANYDGRIKIDTEISGKNASSQMMSLEKRIVQTADKIAALKDKMSALSAAKIPTQEYADLKKELAAAEDRADKLYGKLRIMEKSGDLTSMGYKKVVSEIGIVNKSIEVTRQEVNDLVASGKAFTLGADSPKYSKMSTDLQNAQSNMDILLKKHDELEAKQNKAGSNGEKAFSRIGKAVNKTSGFLKKMNASINGFIKKIHTFFISANKEVTKTNNLFGTFGSRLKGILLSLLVFNWVTKGFNSMIEAIKEGFKDLSSYSASFNQKMSQLVSTQETLKKSIATAFMPIAEIAIPYIVQFLGFLTECVNKVNQLASLIAGKDTWTKAKKVIIDYNESLKDEADAADEAKEALEGYLSPIDEINKFKSPDTSIDTPDGKDLTDMFEEVPIENNMKKAFEAMKEVLESFFAPLKKAWNSTGEKVIDSWKKALNSVKDLVKEIGSDFLEVWNEDETVRVFENILWIISDIGLVVSNLADNFRKAWAANDTGKAILQNIRDIIGIIVENIKHAADTTVEWSKNLNFTPLLESFERFTSSLKPAIDALSGTLTDFYEKVLLPLGKWTLEKGLPQLLDVFTAFNEKVDWNALRERLAQFWEHLEPFAETIGEGLIVFIERCSDLLADFINSDKFDDFLTRIEEWMDNVTPEDVADGIETLAKAIIGLKGALVALDGIIKVGGTAVTLGNIAKGIKSFTAAAGGSGAASLGLLESAGVMGTFVENYNHIKKTNELDDIMESIPKREDYESLEEFNEALYESKKRLEEVSNGKYKIPDADYDASAWDNKFSELKEKISGWWESMKGKWSWHTLSGDVAEWWSGSVTPKLEELKNNIVTWWESMKGKWSWNTLFSNISDWWKNDVSPKTQEVKANINTWWTSMKEKWSFTTLFTKVSDWWKNDVAPKIQESKTNLNTWWGSMKEKFSWNTLFTNISNWWSKDITPWFTANKWTFSGIKDGLKSAFNAAVDAVKQIWNTFANWLNSKLKLTIPPISIMGFTLFGGTTLDLGKIPTFQTGGFPEDGLFAANSGELVGKFSNGKTAVANNDQITTGIRNAVYDAMVSVLPQMNNNGGEIQNADLTFKIGDVAMTQAVIRGGKILQSATGMNPFYLPT